MADFVLRRGIDGAKRWRWRVRLKGYPVESGTCPTKECAKKCAQLAEQQLRAGHTVSRATLAEVIDRYLEEYLPEISDSASLYRRHLGWWRQQLGLHLVSAITPQMLSARKAQLATGASKSGRPVQAATVNRYLVSLSSVFTWAMRPEIGLVERNVVREVARLKEPPGRVRWLSRPLDEDGSELERLLQACAASSSEHLFDVVVLLLSTGCRENEIMRLRRRDIRLAEGGFTIPAELAKNEVPRFVALSGLGLEVVSRRMGRGAADDAYLFPSLTPGKGRKPSAKPAKESAWFPMRAWRTALRRAGLKDLRPHDLRHTHGSYLGMMGKTLPEIMRALGHKTPAVALRYIHLSDSHQRAVNAEVNSRISGWVEGVLAPPQSASDLDADRT